MLPLLASSVGFTIRNSPLNRKEEAINYSSFDSILNFVKRSEIDGTTITNHKLENVAIKSSITFLVFRVKAISSSLKSVKLFLNANKAFR